MPSLPNTATAFVLSVCALQLACASIPPRREAIDSMSFEGTGRVSDSDLNEKISTAASPKFLGLFRGVVYDYELFDRMTLQRDLARIERYYRARGFYDAHARAARVLRRGPNHVRVEIVVDEGEPVLIARLRVLGLEDVPNDVRKAALKAATARLRIGERFDEDDFDRGVADVERALKDRGRARARVVRDATVDVASRAADVTLTVVDASESAVFGEVTIEGLGSIPETPVRRALDIHPGEPYSESALDAARQAVLDLGVMSSVEISPKLDAGGPRGVIPLVVRVEPSKLRTVRLGAGAEFDALKTDVHAIAGYENHDFFGGLRTYSVSLRPGLVLYPLRIDHWVEPDRLLPEFQLRNEFRQPGFLEARTNGLVRPELSLFPVLLPTRSTGAETIPGYVELKTSIGVDRTTWKLYSALSHDVQVEMPFTYRGARDPALHTLVLSYLELITNLDLSDSRVRPHRGAWLGNSLQVAGGPFGGDATDMRVRPDARAYVPLGRHVTLALRGALGFLFPFDYGGSLGKDDVARGANDSESRIRDIQIVFFRGFFAGGSSSNRGYPFRGIGPERVVASPAFGGAASLSACRSSIAAAEDCRIPVGGTTIWESSAEVRFDVLGPLSMATFCDAADVAERRADIRLSHPHLSCGVGARYDTPVGPIRLDVGYRIPGLQVLPRPDPAEVPPDPLFGVLPIALAFGIGEAY